LKPLHVTLENWLETAAPCNYIQGKDRAAQKPGRIEALSSLHPWNITRVPNWKLRT